MAAADLARRRRASSIGHRAAGRRITGPPLAFDESELARVAAAVRLDVERETRAAYASHPAARQAEAMDRVARSLRESLTHRQTEADATTRRVALLAEAIGCAAAAEPAAAPHRLRSIVTNMMAALPAPPALRL